MRILIDPGHGGTQAGAQVGSVREADLNMAYALALADRMSGRGHVVALTRYIDKDVMLGERCHIEHSFAPALFLSIHCNWFHQSEPSGMEVWTSPGVTDADKYAERIAKAMMAAAPGRRFRPDTNDGDLDREGNFYVLKNTLCPAVLVEVGFMSNPEELEWLQSPHLPSGLAIALTKGIEEAHNYVTG